MAALETLALLRDRIAAVLPNAAVVSVHALDLSDAQTRKWLVRLPGVYLVAERIDRRGDETVLSFRVFVLVRLGDMRAESANAGWLIAEKTLAAVCSDPHVVDARLMYRDEAGLDQPGIALWEIDARRRVMLPALGDDLPDCAHSFEAEAFYSSWAPWIGSAHEDKYVLLQDDAPETGERSIEELLP